MRINILGRWVNVIERDADFMDDALGKTDGNTIWILETLGERIKCNTLVHEVMHILFVELDHLQLDMMASLISDALWWNGFLRYPDET